MILVTARLKCISEKRSEFLALVRNLVKASQAEDGCISYRFYEDTEVPSNFIFVEEWESQEILDKHHQEPHFQAFSQKLAGFLASEAEVKIHDVLGTRLG